MAGIYSRKIYDDCYNTEFIDQQVNPCKYRTLNDYAENSNSCHAYNGPRTNKVRATGELGDIINNKYRVELESQLFNLDIPNSKCISMNTLEEKNKRLNNYSKDLNIKFSNCEEINNLGNNNNYTRLNNPVNSLRSVFINRYDFPIIEPKEFVYYGYNGNSNITSNKNFQHNNERFGENTQLRIKDNISKPQLPKFSVLLNQ